MIRGRRRRRPSLGQKSLFQHCHEEIRIIQLPRASIVIVFVATPTMESRERYQELCRLCASYDAVKMDIFGQEGKNRQLVDKIQACLPFKVRHRSPTRDFFTRQPPFPSCQPPQIIFKMFPI